VRRFQKTQPAAAPLICLQARSLLSELPLFALSILLLAHFDSASYARTSYQSETPYVVMDTNRRDFGDVFAGEELMQIFYVRNAGSKQLELAQKSTLGRLTTESKYSLAAVLWKPSERFVTRTAVAMRAAPS
jgi:hypothetical protein